MSYNCKPLLSLRARQWPVFGKCNQNMQWLDRIISKHLNKQTNKRIPLIILSSLEGLNLHNYFRPPPLRADVAKQNRPSPCKNNKSHVDRFI